MKTQITKRNVSALASKDDLKPALTGAFFEPEKSRLTVTNGHALIMYPLEMDDSKEYSTGILPLDLFQSKAKEVDRTEYEVNGAAVRINTLDGSKAEYPVMDDRFPDYEPVMPREYESKFEIVLDLNLLVKIAQAIPGTAANCKAVKLDFTDQRGAVRFQTWGEDIPKGAEGIKGVLMPIRHKPHPITKESDTV